MHREEGRGRPTPPFRFPFLSFLTQRQRLCFLLQAAGPLLWGHPWPEPAPGCGQCRLTTWLTIPLLSQNGFFHLMGRRLIPTQDRGVWFIYSSVQKEVLVANSQSQQSDFQNFSLFIHFRK